MVAVFELERLFYFYLKAACKQACQIHARCLSCTLERALYGILVGIVMSWQQERRHRCSVALLLSVERCGEGKHGAVVPAEPHCLSGLEWLGESYHVLNHRGFLAEAIRGSW